MGLEGRLNRIQREAMEGLEHFTMQDGTRCIYDFNEARMQIFCYAVDCMTKDAEPDVPPILEKIRRAKNPEGVIRRFEASDQRKAFYTVEDLLDDGSDSDEAGPGGDGTPP